MFLDHSRPAPALEAELREVSKDAFQFIEFIGGNNYLPTTFPRDTADKIAHSLVNLHLGTTAGCREPLEYARARLARIRREHTVFETEAQSSNVDNPPPVTRGLALDVLLIRLLASVSTALDKYYDILDTEPDDDSSFESLITRSDGESDLDNIGKNANKMEKATKVFADEFSDVHKPDSINAGALTRQTRDVGNLSKMVEAEVELHSVSTKWVKRFGITLQTYSAALAQTGTLITRGTDIAEILWERWHRLKDRTGRVIIEETRTLGEDLVILGQKYEKQTNKKFMDLEKERPGDGERPPRQTLENLIANGSAKVSPFAAEAYIAEYEDLEGINFLLMQAETGKSIQTRLACTGVLAALKTNVGTRPWMMMGSPLEGKPLRRLLLALFTEGAHSAVAEAELLGPAGWKLLSTPAASRGALRIISNGNVPWEVKVVAFSTLVTCAIHDAKAAEREIGHALEHKSPFISSLLDDFLAKATPQRLLSCLKFLLYLDGKLRGRAPQGVYRALHEILSVPELAEGDRSVLRSILKGMHLP